MLVTPPPPGPDRDSSFGKASFSPCHPCDLDTAAHTALNPFGSLVVQGEHTPGFCLDEARILISPESCQDPGLKAFVLDGMTNYGVNILHGRRTPPFTKEDLPSGFVVNAFPTIVAAEVEKEFSAPPVPFEFKAKNPLMPGSCDSLLNLAAWLGESHRAGLRDVISLNFGAFLKDGLNVDDNLYLLDKGVMFDIHGREGPDKVRLVPRSSDTPWPQSLDPLKYRDALPGRVNYLRLREDTYDYLKRFSAQEIGEKVFDPAKLRIGVQLGVALNQTIQQIEQSFFDKFSSIGRDLCGGVTIAGLVKLPGDSGAAVFTIGDARSFVTNSTVIQYHSTPRSASYYHLGISIEDGKSKLSRTFGMDLKLLPKEALAHSNFLLTTDGWFPSKAEMVLIEELSKFPYTAKAVLGAAPNIAQTIDTLARSRKDFHIPDDKALIFVEGVSLL